MRVTVGLPILNMSQYLVGTIRSIKSQTFEDWECIIIDDGSSDGSLRVIEENVDKRFKILSDGKNLGLVHRLNQISCMAQGEYIARMDGDDIMHPRRLEEQVRFLDNNSEIDLVGSSAYLIDVNNNIYGVRDVPNDFGMNRLLLGSPFVHPSITARREWFRENLYSPDAHRVEDYELWLRSSMTSRFANLPTPLLYYREAGLPYLKKYKSTSRGMRKVASRYRVDGAAASAVYKAILLSLGKEAAFVLLHHLGKGEHLMRARARQLTALEHLNAAMDLNRAVKCE